MSNTVFGSISDYQKGSIEIVSGDPKHYVFSNVFEVAARSKPYERVVVAKNLDYVQEVMRAEGTSPWFASAHDEFALCMDGEIAVEFLKLTTPPAPATSGAVLAGEQPGGQGMGRIRLKRGHQALLPAGCADRVTASRLCVILQQTMLGALSVQKWNEICLHWPRGTSRKGSATMSTALAQVVASDPSNENGYRTFKLGKFELSRDEYFVTI